MNEDDVLAFVRATIRSVWTLEILVLMYQDQQHAWQVAELAAALRANSRVAQEGLAVLEAAGLVRGDPSDGYRCHPASAPLENAAREVVDLYSRKPVAVVKTILTAPTDKIQTFADAFRFRN